MKDSIISFQNFVSLPDNSGVADLNVWMSLLTSKGNTNRQASTKDIVRGVDTGAQFEDNYANQITFEEAHTRALMLTAQFEGSGSGGCVKKCLWDSKSFDIMGTGTPEPGERQE